MAKKTKSSKPIYQQIEDELAHKIKSGVFRVGEYLSPERTLSSEFKVNRITVRKAIKNLITRNLVVSIPGSGNKIISSAEKEKEHAKTIACVFFRNVFQDSGNPYYSRILGGIESEAGKKGYGVLLTSLGEEYFFGDNKIHDLLDSRKIDGIIFAGEVSNDFIISQFEKGIPCVVIDRDIKGKNITSVRPDNPGGSYNAIKYLIEMGHKRIGFIRGSLNDKTVQERYEGYVNALKEAGIPMDERYVVEGHFTVEQGYTCAGILLDVKPMPTAIFAINDRAAVGAIKAVSEKGLKVGKDISIIGFDDIDIAAHTNPPLTTIRIFKEEMGITAVSLLINQIENPSFTPLKSVIPTELVIRDSVGKFLLKKNK
ncbi:GntR family transcriptional regulator [bacterium]|jgi:LacI family transcriptional regulator|nr:GntR family transcriptional regulator [bacterium]